MNSRERLESHASHAIQFFMKVAVIKTKIATIAFSFFHLFFSFRYCDFGAYRAPEKLSFNTFYSNQRKVRFQKLARYTI